MMLAVVLSQLIGLAIEREATLGDPVGDTAHEGSDIGLPWIQIARQVVKPEHDVAGLPVTVGGLDRGDCRSISHDLDDRASVIGQHVEIYGLAVDDSEGLLLNTQKRGGAVQVPKGSRLPDRVPCKRPQISRHFRPGSRPASVY